jgi:ribosomal protein L19
MRADLLGILELQELISPVSSHVNQDIAPIIRHQSFTPRPTLWPSIRQKSNEVLDRDFIASVIDFNTTSHSIVEVQVAGLVVEYGARERVARVAGHVIRKHKNDLRVGDTETLYSTVEGEGVREMTVIEPEAGGRDKDGPVGCVCC